MFQNLPPLAANVIPKTFVADSCDSYVPIVLKQNGWRQLPKTSTNWNLKWTWKAQPKQFENLQQGQYINHFKNSDQMSTKIGLSLLLKKNPIVMDCGKTSSFFYPRSYNLNSEREQFIKDFYHTGIMNLLKKIIVCLQVYYEQQFQQVLLLAKRQKINDCSIFLKQMLQNEQVFDFPQYHKKKLSLDGRLYLRLIFYLQNIFSLEETFEFTQQQIEQLCIYSQNDIPVRRQASRSSMTPSIKSLLLLLFYHKKCLNEINSFYQDGFSNIWAVKSNHSSRGRNISLISDLSEIKNLDNGMKLIQKYVQNIWVLQTLSQQQKTQYPSLQKIVKKKFDIRFWVFVKSFHPFCTYIYDEAYLRVSSDSYRLNELENKTVHLTNYAVNFKNKKKCIDSDENSYVLFSDYLLYLKQQQNADTTLIQSLIKKAITTTLMSFEGNEDNRCFQLFGFDIILDANLNPWILECNMSPACSPRGELSNLVHKMTEGMMSILGFIGGSHHGWKLLASTSHEQISVKKSICTTRSKISKENVCYSQKESKGSNKSLKFQNSMFSTMACWNDTFIVAKKINWKKYKNIEIVHYAVEKVKIIQRFIRRKLKLTKNKYIEQKVQNFLIGKSLKIIQLLARISKRTKKQWLSSMVRKQKKPKRVL